MIKPFLKKIIYIFILASLILFCNCISMYFFLPCFNCETIAEPLGDRGGNHLPVLNANFTLSTWLALLIALIVILCVVCIILLVIKKRKNTNEILTKINEDRNQKNNNKLNEQNTSENIYK